MMNSLASLDVDADCSHIIGGGELLDQYPHMLVHKFAAQRF